LDTVHNTGARGDQSIRYALGIEPILELMRSAEPLRAGFL
jgi:hypothetical protein